jgi:RNA polymerase sigma-32 factor
MDMNSLNSQSRQADLNYMRTSLKIPLLEKEHEKQLTHSWHHSNNEQALHALVQPYIRLVISIALRYRNYGLPLADLIQEGNLGLLQAAVKFDPKREVRFSAYAKWWVRACMQDFILRNWSIVRTGSTTSQKILFFNLNRLRNKLANVNAEFMDTEDQQRISDILQVSIQEVKNMESRLLNNDLSLSATISENGESNWQDLLCDDRPSPEEVSLKNHDIRVCQAWLVKAMKCLNPAEQIIIKKRWLTENSATLEGLGKELKMTKERVRQLEARSIRKLRYYLMDNLQEVRHVLN